MAPKWWRHSTPILLKKWYEGIVGMTDDCPHEAGIADVTPSADGCEECLQSGDWWVHLRLCRTCGHVGCCDNSKNKHATKHYHATKHPIITSLEPGESWRWCYVDNAVV